MPFIKLTNSVRNEYGYGLLAICMTIVVCSLILCCDNVECAILVVQILTVIYCGLWIMVVAQMNHLVSARKTVEVGVK
jgi:hypothetical protein